MVYLPCMQSASTKVGTLAPHMLAVGLPVRFALKVWRLTHHCSVKRSHGCMCSTFSGSRAPRGAGHALRRRPGAARRHSRLVAPGGGRSRQMSRLSGPSARVVAFLFDRLKPATKARYYEGLARVDEFVKQHFVSNFWLADEETQDYILCDMVLEFRDDDEHAVQDMRKTLAAVQKRYAGRRQLKAAFRVLDGWQTEQPVEHAMPFPEPVLGATVVLLTLCRRPKLGTALLVSFAGLLRISEALALTWADVVFPDQRLSGHFAVLMLRTTKRGIADGERVILHNKRLVDFLLAYRERFKGEAQMPFCRASYTTARKWLQRATAAVGFDPELFRTHSCRRGGAMALAMAGLPLSEIMQRGRWASETSCRLYIKKGEVSLLRFQSGISPVQFETIQTLANICERVFELMDTAGSTLNLPKPPPERRCKA